MKKADIDRINGFQLREIDRYISWPSNLLPGDLKFFSNVLKQEYPVQNWKIQALEQI